MTTQRQQHHVDDAPSALRRLKRGAILLVFVFVGFIGAFHWLGGYDWLDAVWLVVVTISSVGYSETSDAPATVQILSIVLIILGMSTAVYTLGGFIQMTLEGEVDRVLGRQRIQRELERLGEHTIICGFGRIGRVLAGELRRKNEDFVVIERDPEQVALAVESGYLCLLGDATDDECLGKAGIRRARFLVSALPSDADNVFITLTAKDENNQINVIARAELVTAERKLKQAGADTIVAPAISTAQHMLRLITRPSTAKLMEMVSETSMEDIELDEFIAPPSIVGKSIVETGGFAHHQVLLVAIRKQNGSIDFYPTSEYRFQPADTLIVMGHAGAIGGMRSQLSQ